MPTAPSQFVDMKLVAIIDNVVVICILTIDLSISSPSVRRRSCEAAMSPDPQPLLRLIDALRVSFNRLKGLTESLHRDLGVNASMRGVMQSLADGGPKTVPAIAREKGVSRQHIQVNVDALLGAGLVEASGNAAHRRSPFISLTQTGKQIFAEARRREATVLESLAGDFAPAPLDNAASVLEALNSKLAEREGKRDDDA